MSQNYVKHKLSILLHCQSLHLLHTITKHPILPPKMSQPPPKSTTATDPSTQGRTLQNFAPVTIIHPTIPPASYDIGLPSPTFATNLDLPTHTFPTQTPEIHITTSELSQVKIFLCAIFGIFVALAIVISVWDWLDSRNVSSAV
jgi:hypothetical protein